MHDASFELASGEVLGLLGPNGSGKTTVLRLLTGYLRPHHGNVHIAAHNMHTHPRVARSYIGYVPENAPLYDHFRVYEFLRTMGQLKGLNHAALRRAVPRVCERLGLEPVFKHMIGQLSRGYRQRVAIAQALINEPPLLIFDEPTSGLDPRQIAAWRALVNSFTPQHAVILTSHILTEIEQVASRVAILLAGELRGIRSLKEQALTFNVIVAGRVLAALRACCDTIAGVRVCSAHCQADTTHLEVGVARADLVATIPRALIEQGFELLSFRAIPTQLESVYFSLTEKP